jgi:hypothetical protein
MLAPDDHGLPAGTVSNVAVLEGTSAGMGGTNPTGAKMETPTELDPGWPVKYFMNIWGTIMGAADPGTPEPQGSLVSGEKGTTKG